MAAGVGSASGEADDALEVHAVALEVAEGLVRDDHRGAFARRPALGVRRIELLEVGAHVRSVGRVAVGAVRVGLGQTVGDRVGEVGHQQRVEPEVRVVVAVLVGLRLPRGPRPRGRVLARLVEVHDLGRVDLDAGGDVGDGLVDGRLELVLEHDDVGLVEGRGLGDPQLEVVRLGAGLGEAGDLPLRAGHLLGDPLEREEGGDRLVLGVVDRSPRHTRPGGGERRRAGRRLEYGTT